VYLLSAAEALAAAGAAGAVGASGASGASRSTGGWDDPRAGRPWELAAAAVLRSLPAPVPAPAEAPAAELPSAPRAAPWRAARLALAEALLTGPTMRLRGISAERILEGLVSRHLSPLVAARLAGAGRAAGR